MVAVVVSNDQPLFLKNTLDALARQSFRVERTLVVDSSISPEIETVLADFEKQASNNAVLKVKEKANFAELSAAAIKQALVGLANLEEVAIWLVHDDCIPEIHALAELVRTLEVSPLVGIASPKQLSNDNPKIIVQQGLTVTRTLKPFSLVNNELDQKQHDSMSDVLAVSTNAMLIRANVWAELGGFSLSAPELAADIDLGIRAHQLGFRVVVVPTARVKHAELSIHGKRPKHWLGGSVKFALAKATNHLRLSQSPLLMAFLYWLALPVVSVLQVLWLLLVKRPDRILYTLRANLWAFFTLGARLRDRHRATIKTLRPLFASSAQVRSRSRLALELEEQKSNLAQFDEATMARPSIPQQSFLSSGGAWLMLLLAGFSYKFLPLGEAAAGGFALPLSQNWISLFASAGSSFQHVGLGLAAPSDPFNWVILLIGSLTFWAPNLALSAVLILAKPVAFFGAWRLLSTVSHRNTIRIALALGYVLWPSFTVAQSDGNFPAVIFATCLPWLLFSLARAGKLGISSSVRSSQQSWSWIATSALLLAVVLASAPSTIPIFILVGLVFAFLTRKKLSSTLFIALPAAAISLPYLLFQILNNKTPLAVIADPTISYPSNSFTLIEALVGKDQFLGWAVIGLTALSLISLLSRARSVFGFWLFGLLVLANIYLLGSISFTSGGLGSIFLEPTDFVFDSPTPLVLLFALMVLLALAIWFDSFTIAWLRKGLVSLVVIGAVLPLAYSALSYPSKINFGEARNLPAIFSAEAKAGSNLKLLVISKTGLESQQSFSAELVGSRGVNLDSISTAYRFSQQNIGFDGIQTKATLADLVSNLVSANGRPLKATLVSLGIGYVLVPNKAGNGELGISLNSVSELDQVGATEFGQLWRVKGSKPLAADKQSLWSITKTVQFSILLGFILLALPTSRGRKAKFENSEANSFEPEGENE